MLQDTTSSAIRYIVQGRNEFFGSKAKSQIFPKAEYQEKLTHTICLSGVDAALGNAIWQLPLPLSHQETEKILEKLRQKKLPFFWWEAPISIEVESSLQNSSQQITDFLVQNGLQVGGLLKGVSARLDLAPQLSAPSKFAIRQVQTVQELTTFCQLIFSIHGLEPAIIEQIYSITDHATQAGHEIHYLAYQDQEPIGGITLATGQAAGLWNFATLPHLRKQGVGSALIQAAIQTAKQHGYHELMAILLPSEMTSLWRQFHFKEWCHFPFYISTGNFENSAQVLSKRVLKQSLL